MEAAGGLVGDAGRTVSCADCGWTGTALSGGRSEPDADDRDTAAPACPRCGAVIQPDLPSADEIRAARQMPER